MGARGWWGGREQLTRKGEREGESKGREVGSDDARQTESVSGGVREGGLVKGTREEGTGRGMDMDSGREEASRGGTERGREGARSKGVRDGNFKGGILKRA